MENNKKEIIIVTTALGNNGAERILTELSNAWIKTGNKVIVIQTGKAQDDCCFELDDRAIVINVVSERKGRFGRYFFRVREIVKIMRAHPNATALAFLSQSFYTLAIAGLFTKNRIVFSERNDPTRWPQGKLRQNLRNWCFCKADFCVFQTREAKRYFPQKAQKHSVIIQNPCNPNLPERCTAERNKCVVSASRLTPQKNLPLLIEAFKDFHEEYNDYCLYIYGEGEERPRIEKLIADCGLEGVAFLPGFDKNIHQTINNASMYVCSSDYEGISNSMLEALCMGIPTISTDCPVGGAREMIDNEVNGLLVPVGDRKELCTAMKRIAQSPELASKLSENAILLREKLKIENIAEKWLQIM